MQPLAQQTPDASYLFLSMTRAERSGRGLVVRSIRFFSPIQGLGICPELSCRLGAPVKNTGDGCEFLSMV